MTVCSRCGQEIRWQPPFGRDSGGIWYHAQPPWPLWESAMKPGYWDHNATVEPS